jgi:hypothetical protein
MIDTKWSYKETLWTSDLERCRNPSKRGAGLLGRGGVKPVTEEPASEHRGGLSARVEIVDRVTPRPGEPGRSADAIHSP